MTETLLQPKIEVKEPTPYLVLLHNDDFTPRQFVVEVLEKFFQMNATIAEQIMLTAHIKGQASCGRFPRDIAETKLELVTEYIDPTGFPLQFSVEPV